jgi:hypothetical protein
MAGGSCTGTGFSSGFGSPISGGGGSGIGGLSGGGGISGCGGGGVVWAMSTWVFLVVFPRRASDGPAPATRSKNYAATQALPADAAPSATSPRAAQLLRKI